MDGLVSNEVTQHKIWCHDEPPIEGEIAERGTVSPLCALAHYIETAPLKTPRAFWGAFAGFSAWLFAP